MPERVCRIRRRKGLRLGLCISDKIGFLDLPVELRDNIYRFILIASEPITIRSYIMDERAEKKTATGHEALTMGLLRCNRQISYNAAAIFYQFNTFHFAGYDMDMLRSMDPSRTDHSHWTGLYVFLQMIGPANRFHLQSLQIRFPKPQQVYQHADRTLTSMKNFQVMPRSAYCAQLNSMEPAEEGLMDYVDPAIEACFRILGTKSNRGASLTLTIMLDQYYLPGLELLEFEQLSDRYTFDLAVPIMIEKMRLDLTATPPPPPPPDDDAAAAADCGVKVLWKGECAKEQFVDHMERIPDCGWVILDQKEGKIHDFHDDGSPLCTTLFTLRMKEAKGS